MSKKHPHHGGAWKVAYADFTTAMMALFLVLWLTAQDTKVKEAIARSFTNPFSSVTKESVGIIPNKDVQATSEQKGDLESMSALEVEMLRRISEDLAKLFQQDPEDPNRPVKFDLTPEGLRINVFDHANRPVFQHDSAEFTEYGAWVFSTLAWEIARYTTFSLELEGHAEIGYRAAREHYGVWELSVDRANAARRKLRENGVREEQVHRVAGYGSTQPLTGTEPESPVNRRVTVLLCRGQDSKTLGERP